MPKRGNGEGSIRERTDGTYEARMTLAGKRLSFYGRTRAEVSAKLKLALADAERGMLVIGPRQTVAQYLDRWLADVATPTIRPSTALRYGQLVRLHIGPRIGAVQLGKLGPAHLTALYKALGERLSARTVGHVHRLLHVALETAVRWDYIARNPADLVSPPKCGRPEFRALTADEARRLLAAASDDPLEALYVLALTTGMRQGELVGLKWADVDLEAGSLQVKRSLSRVPRQGWVEQPPKTAKGRRSITLARIAVDALKRHRVRQNAERLKAGDLWDARDLVFPNALGRPLEENNIRARSFVPLLKRVGLPPMRFHDLRHSAASLLLALGVHPKVVQEQLGHATIAITLDIYSHAVPSLQAEAAHRLGDYLGGTATG